MESAIVAGMLAAINGAIARDADSANTTLGFVNPFVYQHAALFLDITKGDNRGVWAVEGYDPISGVGTWGVDTFAGLKAAALEASRGAARRSRTTRV